MAENWSIARSIYNKAKDINNHTTSEMEQLLSRQILTNITLLLEYYKKRAKNDYKMP